MKRPPTEETVIELTEHSHRHLHQVLKGEGLGYSLAHLLASAGLIMAAKAHEMLDRQDKQRGYR